ncbi:MAG: hypothetical protein HY513_01365 [Candidatus Aenigmarchaeota archaeon]|nr:hypothetical protein [Candidatus Aenigmarchaeota archaeon]
MKPKTMSKIIRRLTKLPLLHLDTSILLESERTEDGYYCKKLLNVVGTKHRGKISLIALGELFLYILGLDNYSDRHDALELIKLTD